MKRFFIFLLIPTLCVQAQYRFEGQVSENFKNRPVYLSLVDDYRKTSRIYTNQIIQKTQADSLGFFLLEGDFLNEKNRIYRIHTDSCNDEIAEKNHLLGRCESSESIVFIANNKDTLSLPVRNQGQAFCDIVSTNPVSGKLLEAELLRELMVLDIVDSDGEKARTLNYQKWFKKLQDFGEQSDEPLVELFCFDFLSDRSSESHHHYLKNLTTERYYTDLLLGLVEKYPDAAFTGQYLNEIEADRKLAAETFPKPFVFKWKDWLPLLSIITLLIFAIGYYWYLKKRNPQSKVLDQLSPREKLIYNAIKNGKTNKEISATLFISLSTVKTHINNIYKKLGVTSRKELL